MGEHRPIRRRRVPSAPGPARAPARPLQRLRFGVELARRSAVLSNPLEPVACALREGLQLLYRSPHRLRLARVHELAKAMTVREAREQLNDMYERNALHPVAGSLCPIHSGGARARRPRRPLRRWPERPPPLRRPRSPPQRHAPRTRPQRHLPERPAAREAAQPRPPPGRRARGRALPAPQPPSAFPIPPPERCVQSSLHPPPPPQPPLALPPHSSPSSSSSSVTMETDETAAPYNSHEADGDGNGDGDGECDHASGCTAADGASGDDESEADPSGAAAAKAAARATRRCGGLHALRRGRRRPLRWRSGARVVTRS